VKAINAKVNSNDIYDLAELAKGGIIKAKTDKIF
jgi:hypothetical protein